MKHKKDFASALAELEQVVAEMDSDVPIEKALDLFERGIKLSSECEKFLTHAQQRIEILKRSTDGSTSVEPFQTTLLDVEE
jgi:exodeoxyribonuclease VII small subunit